MGVVNLRQCGISKGGALLDDHNLQSLCNRCHNRKRQLEGLDGNLRPTGEGRSESLGSDRIRSLSARRSNRTRQAPDMSWATFIEWMPHLMATRYGVEHAVPHLFRDF